jgi:hypothetical protein
MNAATGLDLGSIPDRIQSEVQGAIQRSIKGVAPDVPRLCNANPYKPNMPIRSQL